MSVNREIQVVIAGAGIAGLSLAGFLRQVGVDPVVVETADEFDEHGVPVELWPETMALLDRLGVAEDVRDGGTVVTEWKRRRPDGTVLERLDTDTPGGIVVIPYERLRGRLLNRVEHSSIRMETTLRSVDHTQHPVTVTFGDGVREKFDLVVGADGVHSRTRALLGGASPVASGTTTWTFPLPPTMAFSGANEVWTTRTVFRVLPVDDRAVGALTAPTGRFSDSEADLGTPRGPSTGIDWVLPEALEAVAPEEMRTETDLRSSSDLWGETRVALVGAAAHTPHRLTGLGATLAVEDAAVLVSELVDRDDELPARLVDYAVRRESRIERLHDRPERAPAPLHPVDGPADENWSRTLDIRHGQLTAAFGPGTPQPAVRPFGS